MPSQQTFDAVTERANAWPARQAAAEAHLHKLGTEQKELLGEYEEVAAHDGTRALSNANQFYLFDNDLWRSMKVCPEHWPREVENHSSAYVNYRQVFTRLRNSYRRGTTNN